MSFRKLAQVVSTAVGSPVAFAIAVLFVLAWAVTGPLFDFSDTWQLVINTATTVVTFLMVFLIQNTQNRDSKALHIKLDELIVYTRGADNAFVDLDHLSDEELKTLEQRFRDLANQRQPITEAISEELDERGAPRVPPNRDRQPPTDGTDGDRDT